jgi:hypothetical protein
MGGSSRGPHRCLRPPAPLGKETGNGREGPLCRLLPDVRGGTDPRRSRRRVCRRRRSLGSARADDPVPGRRHCANRGLGGHLRGRMSVGAQRPLLVLSPILAETLARAGLSKQDVQRQLFQHARIPARQFERSTGEWTNLLPGRPSLRDLVKRGRAAAVFRGIRRSGAAGAGRGEGRGHHDRRQRRPVAHQRLRVLPQRDPRLHDIRRVTRHLRRRACYSIEPARCSRRRVRGQTSHLDDTRAPKHARWSAGAALCGPGHSGTRSRSSSASGSGISVRGNVGHASRPSPVALGIRWRCTCGMDC